MHTKSISKVVFLTLLIAIIGVKSSRVVVADPNEIYVYPGDSIQAVINAANPGDVIRVAAGIYRENLFVNKTISIFGEAPTNTIINGGANGHVIHIISPNVVISGFTIQNGTSYDTSYFPSGIFVGSNFVEIRNNLLKDNFCGLQVMHSSNCRIFNNSIIENSYAGIYIRGGSSNNIFFENTIKNNNVFGLWIDSSPSNTFYHNNFVNNAQQWSIFNSLTIFDNGAEGNYWSDYHGQDTDFNGIGNTKYPTLGGYDNYPLMGFFTNFTISYNSQTYFLSTICNSTILNFQFNESEEKINFDVLGPSGTVGFCRIAIPTLLVQNKCVISIDGRTPFNRIWTNATYYYCSFAYENTAIPQKVTIELKLPPKDNPPPPSLFTPMVIAVVLVTSMIMMSIIIFKRRKLRKRNQSVKKGRR